MAPGAPLRRIGILTGGGDAPGLNAVIRAVVKSAANASCEVIGLEDSFDGLIEPNRWRVLTPRDVTGILRIGGTILGTTNRGNPFAVSDRDDRRHARLLGRAASRCSTSSKLDALVVIGGDGTLAIAHEFFKRGIPIVGVPKTIDNDIVGTTNTFGFDTAVSFATDAIDRLHTTAEAHHRVMVVEVMGRYAGWIALYAGVAGGADVDPAFRRSRSTSRRSRDASASATRTARVQHRRRRRGREAGRRRRCRCWRRRSGDCVERLGGIGAISRRGARELTGKESRAVVLGHLQRGGAPTSFDRLLATRFGARAVELVLQRPVRQDGGLPSARHRRRAAREVVGRTRNVPLGLRRRSRRHARWGFRWEIEGVACQFQSQSRPDLRLADPDLTEH